MDLRAQKDAKQRRWRLSLAAKVAAALAVAFLAGLALARAPAPRTDETTAIRLHAAATRAAAMLRVGLSTHRREMEFLASILPTRDLQPVNRDALRLFLRRAQELSPYYALIGVVDPNGQMLVTSNGIAEGANVANRDYFTRGRTGTYVSDAHPAFLLAKALGGGDAVPRLIDVATPVTDGERVLGVLCAHVSAEWAQVIATTTAREAGLDGGRLEIRDAQGDDIGTVGGGEKAAFSATETVAGIGDGGAAHWAVVASLPASRASGMAAAGWPWALAGLVGVALSAALGWAMGRQISLSLENQTLDVVRLGAGRIPEMREESSPELNDLSVAIRMAAEEFAYFGGGRVSEAPSSRFSKNMSG